MIKIYGFVDLYFSSHLYNKYIANDNTQLGGRHDYTLHRGVYTKLGFQIYE